MVSKTVNGAVIDNSHSHHDLLWRPVIPVFFPDNDVTGVVTFRLTVLGRLLITFFLVGLYSLILLAVLTWGRAQASLTAPDPEAVLDNLLTMELYLPTIMLDWQSRAEVFRWRSTPRPVF